MKFCNVAFSLALLLPPLVGTCPYIGTTLGEFSTLPPASAAEAAAPTEFTVRIENISTDDAFTASNGVKWSLGFSPGSWIVHTGANPVFTVGEYDRAQGLEAQSEDGKPDTLVASLQNQPDIDSLGIFNIPRGMSDPGPIRPGEVYEFTIRAIPREQLSLIMMFGQSNDWFYAPESGIPLFDAQGNPIRGDITNWIGLWDVGTEVDQEPGIGADQGPRQARENTGEAGHVGVNPIVGYTADSVMRVTITPQP